MGVLSELIDAIKAIDVKKSVKDYVKKNQFSSISRQAAEGTLQFPVLVSRSMDIDTLQIISRSLERQFSSFIQTVLTMNPDLNVNKDKNAAGYLKKFHQNTGSGVKHSASNFLMNNSDAVGYILGKIGLESFINDDESVTLLLTCLSEGSTSGTINTNKQQLRNYKDYIREDKLNDKFRPQNKLYMFANENLSKKYNSLTEAKTTETKADKNDIYRDLKYKIGEKVLVDNDVKKSNELIPTTLHVKVLRTNDDGENLGQQDFIVGVKSIMHPINSEEMVTNMVSACHNNNKFFDFIRWTSGEISFFKDFLFNVKDIKNDVLNRSTGASPWWLTLKRRRDKAKISNVLPIMNKYLPNASIIISMQEVEFIKSQFGFDLMNPIFVDKIMNTFFLLGFVVVDTSTQIAHFLFDGQTAFQSVTFNGLQRENSASTDTKEILKLINRI
jgi:hypothetical protein